MTAADAERRRRDTLTAAVVRSKATVAACEAATAQARVAARRALRKAVLGGVSKAALARELGTSESRVRQEIHLADAEAEIARPTKAKG